MSALDPHEQYLCQYLCQYWLRGTAATGWVCLLLAALFQTFQTPTVSPPYPTTPNYHRCLHGSQPGCALPRAVCSWHRTLWRVQPHPDTVWLSIRGAHPLAGAGDVCKDVTIHVRVNNTIDLHLTTSAAAVCAGIRGHGVCGGGGMLPNSTLLHQLEYVLPCTALSCALILIRTGWPTASRSRSCSSTERYG